MGGTLAYLAFVGAQVAGGPVYFTGVTGATALGAAAGERSAMHAGVPDEMALLRCAALAPSRTLATRAVRH